MLAQENSSIFTYILLLLLLLFCDYCFSFALLLFFPFFNIYLFFILFYDLFFLLCVFFYIIYILKCFSFVKCMNFCKSHTFWFIFHFEFFREIIEKKFIVSSIFLTCIEAYEVKRFLMYFFHWNILDLHSY